MFEEPVSLAEPVAMAHRKEVAVEQFPNRSHCVAGVLRVDRFDRQHTRLFVTCFDKYLVWCHIEVTMEQRNAESFSLAMSFQHFTNFSQTLHVALVERLDILDVFEV